MERRCPCSALGATGHMPGARRDDPIRWCGSVSSQSQTNDRLRLGGLVDWGRAPLGKQKDQRKQRPKAGAEQQLEGWSQPAVGSTGASLPHPTDTKASPPPLATPDQDSLLRPRPLRLATLGYPPSVRFCHPRASRRSSYHHTVSVPQWRGPKGCRPACPAIPRDGHHQLVDMADGEPPGTSLAPDPRTRVEPTLAHRRCDLGRPQAPHTKAEIHTPVSVHERSARRSGHPAHRYDCLLHGQLPRHAQPLRQAQHRGHERAPMLRGFPRIGGSGQQSSASADEQAARRAA
jgi:hypothetical protein